MLENEKMNKILLKELIKYQGKSFSELIIELDLPFVDKLPKNIAYIISSAIIKQIEKNKNITFDSLLIKTIRVNKKNTPIESMSFAQIKFDEIVREDWENSYLFRTFNSEFLFFIFQLENKNDKDPILINSKFWKMNPDDLELVNKFWELTKDNIKRGDYNNFISIKNNFICHVRSKGANSRDTSKTPQGTFESKKGYWLNASYIKTQIK
jgi:DNA mismatch repair protein MutH